MADFGEELVKKIVEEILAWERRVPVIVGVSNRHVHISEDAEKILFGGNKITVKAYLRQPGQFAANETVKLLGPKGMIDNVRIVGPVRKSCQVEVSISDCYHLGVEPVVRDSGQLKGTPGIYIIGPAGVIKLEEGVIVAQRHIHMKPEEARSLGVKDGDIVRIRFEKGIRCGVLGGVLVRVSENYALECHLDVEEANALGVKTGDIVYMEVGGI
ncbi:MAG: phosphate propanoyltransferase [Synergistetes bacterium]|nr:phosphate propanoyltransferase [Synergistota bacterium]MCX8127754.1 phosphate propanoyltransferase [Synergistota bacterium]MDW8191330.1 phosphate propanoyltransferase [Synergistota bacterium]